MDVNPDSIHRLVENLYGEPACIIHPFVLKKRHIDWMVYGPSPKYPYWTILSDNLASLDLRANSPREVLYAPRVEIAMFLSRDEIKPGQTDFPWYVDAMRNTVEWISDNERWLDDCLVFPGGAQPAQFAQTTDLDHIIFLQPMRREEQGGELNNLLETAGRPERILVTDFIHGSEYAELKRNGSKSRFYNWLIENQHSHIIDPQRKPYTRPDTGDIS